MDIIVEPGPGSRASSSLEPPVETAPSPFVPESQENFPKVSKASKKRSEIKVQHSVHDRLQVESNYTFDLRPRSEEEQQRDFKVDLYLFIPNAVGVDSSNFDSDRFFRHRTSHYRVRAPLYQHLRTIEPSELRFEFADRYFQQHLSTQERAQFGGKLVQDVKLFGNFLHTELKKIRAAISTKKKPLKKERKEELCRALLHRAELLWAVRERYLVPLREERYLMDDEVLRAFTLTDEYLSYRLELVLLRAREVFKDRADDISEVLKREIQYRQAHGLLILGDQEKDSVAFEAYTYRLGLLKKYLGESLFLDAASNKKDKLYKNYAAAIGAGLAATVAGLAEHQRVQYLTGNDSGVRLAFLIGIAVLAYIFKDRVKDLSKEYFNTRLKERLPDESFALSHTSYTNKGAEKVRHLGVVSAYFRFLDEIPADVAYLRTLGQTKASDPERHENVIHVGRRFSFGLRSKRHRKLFPLLKNVFRLEISPFLAKLDNPTMPISFVGEKGKAKTVLAPKVYHINVVLRSEVKFGTKERSSYVDYERFRLIVNKNGIQRLERIVEPGRLAYEDKRK